MGLDYIISTHLMQNHGKAGRSVLSNRYSVAVQKADLTKKSSYGAFRLPTVSPPMPPTTLHLPGCERPDIPIPHPCTRKRINRSMCYS